MKVVLFCGGLGTRIRDYSENIPKPMIPIGQRPILWHIMQYYSQYGHRDFVLCLGHKGHVIKEYFLNSGPSEHTDCVISLHDKKFEILGEEPPDWRVTLVDTGMWRNIGQRLMAVRHLIKDEEMFLANYSDGLTDAPLPAMVDILKKSGKTGCFVAVRAPISFHLTEFEADGIVTSFRVGGGADLWINGGYFIFRNRIFDYIHDGDDLIFEPFSRLIAERQLIAYRHEGFFRMMDTMRDKQALDDMADRADMPWRIQGCPPR
jgi:glucose-1-phosphate cytidylyltransferase